MSLVRTQGTLPEQSYTQEVFEHRYTPLEHKAQTQIPIDRLPPTTLDKSRYYIITEATLLCRWKEGGEPKHPCDLIQRVEFLAPGGERIDLLTRDQLEISYLGSQMVPNPQQLNLPFDFTGFTLKREHYHGEVDLKDQFSFHLRCQKGVWAQLEDYSLRLKLVGKKWPTEQPQMFFQHQFQGSDLIPAGEVETSVELDFRGLIRRYDLITTEQIQITYLIHDDSGFLVTVEPQILADGRLWYPIAYDQPVNLQRFKNSRLLVERKNKENSEDNLILNLHALSHNFNLGTGPLLR